VFGCLLSHSGDSDRQSVILAYHGSRKRKEFGTAEQSRQLECNFITERLNKEYSNAHHVIAGDFNARAGEVASNLPDGEYSLFHEALSYSSDCIEQVVLGKTLRIINKSACRDKLLKHWARIADIAQS
jgi:hypothetical protein